MNKTNHYKTQHTKIALAFILLVIVLLGVWLASNKDNSTASLLDSETPVELSSGCEADILTPYADHPGSNKCFRDGDQISSSGFFGDVKTEFVIDLPELNQASSFIWSNSFDSSVTLGSSSVSTVTLHSTKSVISADGLTSITPLTINRSGSTSLYLVDLSHEIPDVGVEKVYIAGESIGGFELFRSEQAPLSAVCRIQDTINKDGLWSTLRVEKDNRRLIISSKKPGE